MQTACYRKIEQVQTTHNQNPPESNWEDGDKTNIQRLLYAVEGNLRLR